MSKKYLLLLFTLCLTALSVTPALAAVPVAGVDSMENLYTEIQYIATKDWGTRISSYAIGLLWWVSLIAFAIGCKDLMISGGLQFEGVIALFVRFAFLTGLMVWLLRSPGLFFLIPDSLERLGGFISTGKYESVLALDTMSLTFSRIIIPIMDYYQTLSFFRDLGLIIVCCVLIFFLNCLSVLFITTILLVKIETIFIMIGGMITASFFVLGYFRDIFMGYIKALATNGLKLLLLSLCLGLMQTIIIGWGDTLGGTMGENTIYDVVMPMSFALMAFYIVVKAVPQYAVGILTGHATADGSLAKAAVVAGVGGVTTVFNMASGTAKNTASTVKTAAQAYQAYSSTVKSVTKEGGSTAKARGMGAWEALKTLATEPITGGVRPSGSSGNTKPSGKTDSPSDKKETRPGATINPFDAQESYDQNNTGGKNS